MTFILKSINWNQALKALVGAMILIVVETLMLACLSFQPKSAAAPIVNGLVEYSAVASLGVSFLWLFGAGRFTWIGAMAIGAAIMAGFLEPVVLSPLASAHAPASDLFSVGLTTAFLCLGQAALLTGLAWYCVQKPWTDRWAAGIGAAIAGLVFNLVCALFQDSLPDLRVIGAQTALAFVVYFALSTHVTLKSKKASMIGIAFVALSLAHGLIKVVPALAALTWIWPVESFFVLGIAAVGAFWGNSLYKATA